ncbi:MAG TPA: tetratricopeptide repeat protein [Kofleriaceae bacterium]|nr:tetratricopeptide repeat protein [Kofleriaceae bacterium]
MTLAEVRALREAGHHAEHLAAARALAVAEPSNAEAQLEAAYAHDHADRERDAIGYYDAAFRLGVPAHEKRVFFVGFGSTLRNVGRADESVAVLAQAIAEDPDYPPFHAFLALALFSSGHPREALAAMLGLALDVARPGAFDRYERALGEYQREFLGDVAAPM